MKKRLIIVAVLLIVVAIFFLFDLQAYFTVHALKESLGGLRDWREQSPWLSAGLFFTAYVVMAVLSLPGAAVMTLAGGALFGLLTGLVIVSFASSIGALLAFLVARYLLHDSVQSRFGERLKAINKGVSREGAFYLFTLRLIPIFPFFVINLVMALTPMRAWTFYWVSQVGMLLGTAVYVNAGTQLAQIDNLAGILSPGLIASFVLIGLFPWLAKVAMRFWQRRRLYAKWTKPEQFDRNLIVIGGGAAGLVSAYIAAAVRAKVTLVEAGKMGGDCLNVGCVPSKALIASARAAYRVRHADVFGIGGSIPRVNFEQIIERVHRIIRAIEPHDSIERYTGLGVDVVQGYARLVDPWTVDISLADGSVQRLTARSIVIAAGAEPFVPPLPGIEEAGYETSDTLWEALRQYERAPRRVAVLGGGPIGCELAQAMARLGSTVTLVEMADQLLLREDNDVAEVARKALEVDGVIVMTGYRAARCQTTAARPKLIVERGEDIVEIDYDLLLCAVGRKARLRGYGLEELGIDTDRTVITDEYLATLYPNIYAAGDVAGPYQFTHTAAHQAWYAAVNGLFGDFKKFKADYRVIPAVTYIEPEIARVGLNEAEASAQGIAYEVTRYPISDLDRAIADSTDYGFVKVLTPPGKDRILGVTIVGEHAGELLAEYVLAMRWKLGLNKILSTIHSYPTMAEANKYAAGEWKKAHAPEWLLTQVGRFHDWRRG